MGQYEKFEKVRKDFNERSDTYRKLILYRCKIRCCIVDREEPSESYSEGEIKKLILNKSDISNGFNREVDSTGITLDFIILYERENNGNFSYVDIEKKYKIQISDSGNKYKRMDWTQERENFFKRLKTSIEQVILKTNDFFEKPVDEVAAIIDDKINALSFKVEN